MKIIQVRIDYEREDGDMAPAELGEIVEFSIDGRGSHQVKTTVRSQFEQEMDDAKVIGNIVLYPHTPREGTH